MIGSNEWRAMLSDCNITDPDSKYTRPELLDTVFISTNYEEEGRSLQSKVNIDDKLMRFEFYEALVRLGVAKYVKSG
eukprot:CAMPEP_0202872372 /NCGR_PEP_ID=MMETSP1391-20130828/21055_1 /ASSEMBLY_ACC=CAM_ASM_000867 /TAXON_ID=1034604 /ORGANISM="Chlamydomonas leiostraca, Strain SAG 11-49" /LENGTH=76 /DNA_ID=CAMNT_0049553399 /DNA_START=1 /DNA_END=227 /DNA_ORIENTATION=-